MFCYNKTIDILVKRFLTSGDTICVNISFVYFKYVPIIIMFKETNFHKPIQCKYVIWFQKIDGIVTFGILRNPNFKY